MRRAPNEFTEEQRRVLVNLDQQYDAWISTARALKRPHTRRRPVSANGNNATEWDLSKSELGSRLASIREVLSETARIYVALKLPRIDADAAKILQAADIQRRLGNSVLVGGSMAMLAYHIEAICWIKGLPGSAENIELLTAAPMADGVHEMLKQADNSYAAHPERTGQLLNNKGYAVNAVTAPELFHGRPVSHVVVAKGGKPARIVAPDPRYFALLREENDKHDEELAHSLLAAIKVAMPHYRLDDEFAASLRPEGRRRFEVWQMSDLSKDK